MYNERNMPVKIGSVSEGVSKDGIGREWQRTSYMKMVVNAFLPNSSTCPKVKIYPTDIVANEYTATVLS